MGVWRLNLLVQGGGSECWYCEGCCCCRVRIVKLVVGILLVPCLRRTARLRWGVLCKVEATNQMRLDSKYGCGIRWFLYKGL